MTSVSSGRPRLLVGVLVGALVLALASLAAAVAALILGGSEDGDRDDDEAARVSRAVGVEDLCAVVQPLVPAELALGTGRSTTGPDPAGVRRSGCVFGSSGDASLEVRVTSYDLTEADRARTLDQLLATACDAAAQRFPVLHTADASGCSGRDAEATGEPVAVSASQVDRLDAANAVVTVVLRDRRLPEQVAAYAAAITYGLVAAGLPEGS